MIQVAVLGYGVVGSGVVEALEKNHKQIAKRAGAQLAVKYIVDIRKFPDSPHKHKFTKAFDRVLADPEITIVAEVIGGINPAYAFVKQSLEAGKSVVTSNKELVAEKGAELLALARTHKVNFLFEASVGGGIPIIRPLHQCLGGNQITRIAGILNGTTNYILTKMIAENITFEAALTQASELGYAEADPTDDVDGHDACRKICILASLAYGKHIYPQWVSTEGIRHITAEDIAYAEQAGCVIKLIGQSRPQEDGRMECFVSPAFVTKASKLSTVDDAFNAVFVHGNMVDDVVFYGRGAGMLPTASAVVGDMIECAQRPAGSPGLWWDDSTHSPVVPIDDVTASFYVRLEGAVPRGVPVAQTLTARPGAATAILTTEIPRGVLVQALAGNTVLSLLPVLEV